MIGPEKKPVTFALAFSLILIYATLRSGAVQREPWMVCLIAIGLLGVLYWLLPGQRVPVFDALLGWLMGILAAYVALQLLPFPAAVLRVLSPARADILQAVTNIDPGVQSAPLSVMPRETLDRLMGLFAWIVAFHLARDIAWGLRRRIWVLATPILIVGFLEAVLGLVQGGSGHDAVAVGSYVNRDHYAGLLEMCLPFAVMFAVWVFHRVRGSAVVSQWNMLRLCSAALLPVVISLGLIQSLSRMGLVASLFGLALIGALGLKRQVRSARNIAAAVVILAACCGSLWFLPARFMNRFAELSVPGALDAGRLPVWSETFRLFAAYLWFGCGLGCRKFAYLKYKTEYPLFTTDFAHSDYLQLLAELGVLGFIVVLVLVSLLLTAGTKGALAQTEKGRRYMALACAGALASIALHSLVDFGLQIPANALMLAWIAGTSWGLWELAREHPA